MDKHTEKEIAGLIATDIKYGDTSGVIQDGNKIITWILSIEEKREETI